jgi:hypothetical protein
MQNFTPSPEFKEIAKQAIDTFGRECQLRKAIEECLELALALTHYLDWKVPACDVAAEIADVKIMLLQLECMDEFNADIRLDSNWMFKQKILKLQAKLASRK